MRIKENITCLYPPVVVIVPKLRFTKLNNHFLGQHLDGREGQGYVCIKIHKTI